MNRRAHDWLQGSWYGGAPNLLLWPLSLLYLGVVGARSALYRRGLLATRRCAVPVIVVGNITVGGTGKTPVVIWLVNALRERGWSPGVVSRGYGGRSAEGSMRVESGSDPLIAGDEPVLIAARTGCPIVIDRDRGRGAAELAAAGADVVVADDGLQHHALERDFEICVVDGSRGLGNGHVLPAGPLREAASRLNSVDQVLVNGNSPADVSAELPSGAIGFELVAGDLRPLDGGDASPLSAFADRRVHAVAAIGNPQRFFDLLRRAGLDVIEHPFPDHAALSGVQLDFGDELPVIMTEKDAVKVRAPAARLWALPVDLDMDPAHTDKLLGSIETRIGTPEGKD